MDERFGRKFYTECEVSEAKEVRLFAKTLTLEFRIYVQHYYLFFDIFHSNT